MSTTISSLEVSLAKKNRSMDVRSLGYGWGKVGLRGRIEGKEENERVLEEVVTLIYTCV